MSENTWELVEERRALKEKLEVAKTRKQKLAATYTNMYSKKKKRVMRWREAAGAGDKRKRIDEIAQEGPLLIEIRCAVSYVSAGEMNTDKWHNQILSIVLSSVSLTFTNWACAQRRKSGSKKISIFNIGDLEKFCRYSRWSVARAFPRKVLKFNFWLTEENQEKWGEVRH